MTELSLVLKATIILASGLLAARLARRASAGVRAAILASTFAALLLLPVFALFVADRAIEIPVTYQAATMFSLPEDVPLVRPSIAVRESRSPESRWTLSSLATIVRAGWSTGAVLFLSTLVIGLVRALRLTRGARSWSDGSALVERIAQLEGIGRPPRLFLHPDLGAPITCGLFRPRIGLPLDAPRWTETALRQALVHELEHVRRRDWAIQVGTRIACALYWYHPLAWIAFRRLRLESERACDDAVVRGHERTEYAEQLVLLARRLSRADGPPLLSMADRSNLSIRIAAVLDASLPRRRTGAIGVAAIFAIGIAATAVLSPLQAAAPPQKTTPRNIERPADTLAFGVASVRPADPDDRSRGFGFTLETGRLRLRNQTVRTMISVAYSPTFSLFFPDERIAGGPDWMNSERYTLEARAERAVSGTEMGAMLRALLAQRFSLKVRVEARELPVYALVLARSDRRLGPELRRSEMPCAGPPCGIGGGAGHTTLVKSEMGLLANVLTELVGRPVLDRTGLDGAFDGTLTWTPTPEDLGPFGEAAPAAPAPGLGPSLFTALEEQFGLKLQSQRGPVEFLTVESVERPTPNDAPELNPAVERPPGN